MDAGFPGGMEEGGEDWSPDLDIKLSMKQFLAYFVTFASLCVDVTANENRVRIKEIEGRTGVHCRGEFQNIFASKI